MTRVLMVSGSWPPQVCGVGDYTERLSRELEQSGIDVVRFADGGLAQLYSSSAVRRADEAECDLVHVQYPTAGYGRSLTPSALPARIRDKPVVVTLHEYSLFRWYRSAWFSPYARHCAARVFTTDEERDLFQRRFPDRSGSDVTIGIASNIPAVTGVVRQPNRVAYFGLIAPNKGIEAFLDLCQAARTIESHLAFDLLGAIPAQHRGYAEAILSRATALKVNVALDLANDRVAARLAESTFAYLPFPDGASGKRGTLAAAIVNGLIVLTRHTDITPRWMRTATLDAETPQAALNLLLHLQANDRRREAAAAQSALAATRFRWDAIAERHVDMYRSLLGAARLALPTAPASGPSRMAS